VIRGEFGVRLEDDMVITDQGAELFTPQSQSLEDPFQGSRRSAIRQSCRNTVSGSIRAARRAGR
jgi:hypothetical protein